jgi:hypothetical protein
MSRLGTRLAVAVALIITMAAVVSGRPQVHSARVARLAEYRGSTSSGTKEDATRDTERIFSCSRDGPLVGSTRKVQVDGKANTGGQQQQQQRPFLGSQKFVHATCKSHNGTALAKTACRLLCECAAERFNDGSCALELSHLLRTDAPDRPWDELEKWQGVGGVASSVIRERFGSRYSYSVALTTFGDLVSAAVLVVPGREEAHKMLHVPALYANSTIERARLTRLNFTIVDKDANAAAESSPHAPTVKDDNEDGDIDNNDDDDDNAHKSETEPQVQSKTVLANASTVMFGQSARTDPPRSFVVMTARDLVTLSSEHRMYQYVLICVMSRRVAETVALEEIVGLAAKWPVHTFLEESDMVVDETDGESLHSTHGILYTDILAPVGRLAIARGVPPADVFLAGYIVA